MNVGELKQWLANKKDEAIVEVIAHNKAYAFSMTLGGGSDGGNNDYTEVGFYVDELCQSEKEIPNVD